jgi:hypothetical protein
LKFCVIEFCWLDSTVSTALLVGADEVFDDEPELVAELLLLLPHAAKAAAAASAQHAPRAVWLLIHRFIERVPL